MKVKHPRRRASKKSVFSGIMDGFDSSDFPVRHYLIRYALKALEVKRLNENLIDFTIMLMKDKAREKVINAIYGVDSKTTEPERIIRADEMIIDFSRRQNSINELMKELSASCYSKTSDLYGLLSDELKRDSACRNSGKPRQFKARLDELQQIFDLSREEIEILIFIYCVDESDFSDVQKIFENFTFQDYLKSMSAILEIPYSTVKRSLSRNGTLASSKIIIQIDTKRASYFSLSEKVCDYLAGISDSSLMSQYVQPQKRQPLPVSSFNIDPSRVEIIRTLLGHEGRCNILLYGHAGTGKTEFARSIVKHAGMEPYVLKFADDEDKRGSSDDSKILSLKVAMKSVPPATGVLIADEADFILNTTSSFFGQSSVEKGWLNEFIDASGIKIIWISNSIGRMEESTLRRFSYSMHFDRFRTKDRVLIWNNILKGHPLKKHFTRADIELLSEEFSVSAGGISSAIESIGRIIDVKNSGKDVILSTARELLARHEEVITGDFDKSRKPALAALSQFYRMEILNTDCDIPYVMSSAKIFSERLKSSEQKDIMNMNFLFWGQPGTGKTEFVKYLSRESGLKLIVKRFSDLESKWVGETEQNIRDAFREASDKNGILFIDEADSIFTARESARASWEVSRTNEMLTQMENFRGMFIACTNHLPHMDRAAMRRFSFKIEFKPMKKEYRVSLFAEYFGLKPDAVPERAASIVCGTDNLTPGDIKAVYEKYRYLDRSVLDLVKIAEDIAREASYRKEMSAGKIGFGG